MARVAINGFGRIGRQTFRRILETYPGLDVVAINDLTDEKTLMHLLRHDSNYGFYDGSLEGVKLFTEKDPENLPWKDLGVDIVLECTGFFTDRESAEKHITAGAKKVIISAPCKSKEVPSFVLGVNVDKYDSSIDVMDMGSCTTNCLATVAKVLQDNFGIEKGFMTTVHSYTNDQSILDLPHKDLRRARAAALNIIPTSTGAAAALGKVIPDIQGKLDGIAIRVPTPVVSVVDLIVNVGRATTKEEVNEAFQLAAAKENFKGILGVETEPLVSSDFKGNTHSSVVDLEETMVNGNLVKVLAWYDNEAGYSARLADFADFISKKL